MTVLITGANGQVGWELVKLAKRENIPYVGLDRQGLDITSPQAVRKTITRIRPSCIINAAAYTSVDKAEKEVEQAFAVNQLGPKYLAQSCSDLDIPLIHISTDYVFDGTKGTPYTPEDEPNPINVYGESKLAGEEEVKTCCEKSIIVRTSWVFGEHGSNFVKSILRFAAEGQFLKVIDDQIGSPTPAELLAKVLMEFSKNLETEKIKMSETYHLGGEPFVSRYEFAKIIVEKAKFLNLQLKVRIEPINEMNYQTKVKRPKNSCLTDKRLDFKFGTLNKQWIEFLPQVLSKVKD